MWLLSILRAKSFHPTLLPWNQAAVDMSHMCYGVDLITCWVQGCKSDVLTFRCGHNAMHLT